MFDQPKSVWQQLEVITCCGRAKPTWNQGKLSVLVDRLGVPIVQSFNENNIVLNSLKTEKRSQPRIDEIVVRFINQAKDWQHD